MAFKEICIVSGLCLSLRVTSPGGSGNILVEKF